MKNITPLQAADQSLIRAGLPTHGDLILSAALDLALIGNPGPAVPRADSDTDYLHLQAFNVNVTKLTHVTVTLTVLAKDAAGAVPAARRAVAADPGLRDYRKDSLFTLLPTEAWKVHDWDAMDKCPLLFQSRRLAEDHARFHGHGRFQTDELSRAIFYRQAEQEPAGFVPAPDHWDEEGHYYAPIAFYNGAILKYRGLVTKGNREHLAKQYPEGITLDSYRGDRIRARDFSII